MAIFAAALAAVFACQPKENIEFALDNDSLVVGADGGSTTIEVSSSGPWIASVNVPWITVSPANGNGSHECQIIVDSALVLKSGNPEDNVRRGTVTIVSDDWDSRDISVEQYNYGYTIAIDKAEIKVPDYDDLADRYFDITVNSNVKFAVSYADASGNPVSDPWIVESEDNPELALTKGARPRNVTLRFNWDINQFEASRAAQIVFTPVDETGAPVVPSDDLIARIDRVSVTQTSAPAKPENPRAADSTALVAISRSLNVWSGGWDTSTPMNTWSDVVLWEEGDDTEPENIGRVRYVRFFMFNTEDGLPYQVKYLTAAEEVVFYSNENNTRRKGIVLGEDICELDQLKRLTIAAYGLDDESLSERFFTKEDSSPAFPNLEYLNLSSNNFMEIPEGICEKNFPKLHALLMNNNQRILVTDASNAAVNDDKEFAEKYAGLFNEYINPENEAAGGSFPVRFLSWDNLDTLQFTLNYFQGSLPSDDYLKSKGFQNWKDDDKIMDDEGKVILSVADSLKNGDTDFFSTHQIPKVLPRIKSLAINLNRMSGEVPNWILRHPNLDIWDPFVFIFTQEGRDRNGNAAGFSNAPKNLNDYYEVFGNKKYDPDNMVDDDEADDSSEAGTGSTR